MNLASRLRPRPFSPGDTAPVVSLTAHDGSWIQSADFVDRYHLVLLFFHAPSGAEGEMLRAFDAQREAFEELDTLVFGINQDRPDKLRSHHASLGLSFPLLSDKDGKVSEAYGSALKIPFMGTFSNRQTYIIDPEGNLRWVFTDVESRLKKHAEEVIDKLKGLQA